MPFDIERFISTPMQRKTEKVPCPDLAAFFGDGEEHFWEIQTLTAVELCRCNEAKERSANVGMLLEAAAQTTGQIEALRKAIGLTKDTPGEIAKRMELLVYGSVSPKVSLEQAVVFAERYGADFYQITNRILILSGSGFDVVKPGAASPQITV
jgi:hypothetical protein